MSVVSIDFQDGVNDFDVGVNESIFSVSFVYPMTHMNAQKWLSLMIFKIILMTCMLALMKVYFSLLYVE